MPELLLPQHFQSARGEDARVVDQHRDRPGLRGHPIDRLSPGARVGDIKVHSVRPAGESGGCRLGTLEVDVREIDGRAHLLQRARGRLADTAGRSGDQRDLSLQ